MPASKVTNALLAFMAGLLLLLVLVQIAPGPFVKCEMEVMEGQPFIVLHSVCHRSWWP